VPVDLIVARQRTWHRAKAVAMGCECEILVDGGPNMIAAAFARLREIETHLSRFLPDSELNRLHHSAERWVAVSPDLFSALRWAKRLSQETNGSFDPTIRTALEALGYDRTFRDIDPQSPLRRTSPAPGLAGLQLDDARSSAWLPGGIRIDLGGVGKGLAADILAHELMGTGAGAAFVCLGGDIQAAGEPPDGGWPVPILHPLTDEPIAHHTLVEGALVMSTVSLRRWSVQGRMMHHIIDPQTGRPTDGDIVAVAVATRSAARAEGLAKAAIVAGMPDAITLLAAARVRAWIVTDHGDVTSVSDDSNPER
jgi:thiamine biosynthesis lipoprotein